MQTTHGLRKGRRQSPCHSLHRVGIEVITNARRLHTNTCVPPAYPLLYILSAGLSSTYPHNKGVSRKKENNVNQKGKSPLT